MSDAVHPYTDEELDALREDIAQSDREAEGRARWIYGEDVVRLLAALDARVVDAERRTRDEEREWLGAVADDIRYSGRDPSLYWRGWNEGIAALLRVQSEDGQS